MGVRGGGNSPKLVLVRGLSVVVLAWSVIQGTVAHAHVAPGVQGAPGDASARSSATGLPNILIIVSDDQPFTIFDSGVMPDVFANLVNKGVNFTRAYDVSGECCPSRSEILTGLYEHHTGVDGNIKPLMRPTIVQGLHDLGYRTSLAGKYLNSATCDPLPEFDQFVCYGGKYDTGGPYKDPILEVNGVLTQFSGYEPDILASFTSSFITSTPTDQPFFAMYTPPNPHLPANDPRCTAPVNPYRPPSYDENTLSDGKPAYVARPKLTSAEKTNIDQQHKKMVHLVQCLDPNVQTVLDSLGSREDDTIVFYLSDNGYLYGEHRLWTKWFPYEEGQRVPFVIRYPPLVPESQPFTTDALVENVDIAPTIAELAGIPWGADGQSLVGLLSGTETTVRDGALIEKCESVSYPCPSGANLSPSFYGVVTSQYKYVEYQTGEKELYDLNADPYEITNQAGKPGYGSIQSTLAAQLAGLKAPPPPETTIVTGPSGDVGAGVYTFTYFTQSRLATYQCRLTQDSVPGPWTSCNGQTVNENIQDVADYLFEVYATDEFGTSDLTPASRSFQVTGLGPDIQIDSGPPAYLSGDSASFTYSSQTPGVTFECELTLSGSVGSFSACSASGITYSGLADGVWEFQVRAVDGSGNHSDPPATWTFQLDNLAPRATFDQTPAAVTNQTTATFAFHFDETTTAVTCQVDLGPSTDCSTGSYVATGLTEAAHELEVTATDLAGNVAVTTFAWTVDLTAPTLTITGLPDSGYTKAKSITLTLTSSEPLGGFDCGLDGAPLAPCTSPVSYTGLLDGTHTFTGDAVDQAGNVSSPTTVSWVVDNVPPILTVTGQPAKNTMSTMASFNLSSNEPGTFQCSLDGAVYAPCVTPATYTGLADGSHSFKAQAVDLAGNLSAQSYWSWTVDTRAPIATITSGPSDPTTSTTATFTFTSDETGSTFQCSLDGAVPRGCTSPSTFTGLQVGTHQFTVQAKDKAGNKSPLVVWAWTITTHIGPHRFL